MHTSFMIIDDFLGNPDIFRDLGLKEIYSKPEQETNFPGRNSEERMVVPELDEMVGKILGEKLYPTPGTGHGRFRLTLANEKGKANVHVDESHWSGILYLSPDEYCQGGTDFFRHKPTDSDRAPMDETELGEYGLEKPEEVFTKIIGPDTHDESKWERIMTIPMRYNRLVLLRPWLWHTAGAGFGDGPENGRLVYLMFYNSEGAA